LISGHLPLQERHRFQWHAAIWARPEDEERINPDLVVRDKKGEPYSVRYYQVNVMLLNESTSENAGTTFNIP
jgi:hypothetical protein